jgi:glycosyltransferase involved in cell wall biosynthesis
MISLVIPLYNEQESLGELHRQIGSALAQMDQPYEILFIDDGSRDTSWNVVRQLAATDPHIKAIRFRRNFGKACALNVGFQASMGDLVITMDADLQDDPAEIPRFLSKLYDNDLDVVSGWKRKRYDPWHKVFPSRVFNAMVSKLTGCRLHDHNCGFKLYRSQVVKDVQLYGELHRFVPVLASARGFKVGEIEVHHRPRTFGHSKYGWNRMFKGFLDLLAVTARTRFGGRPIHLLGGSGIVMIFLALTGLLAALLVGVSGSNAGWKLALFAWIGGLTGTILTAIGLAMEWNLAEQNGGPWAKPNIAETIGEQPRA